MKSELRIFKEIRKLIHVEHRNCLIAIVGGSSGLTGLGKSYIGLRLCEETDETFKHDNIEQRIVWDPMEFTHIVNEAALEKGNAVMFEEAGVGIDNQNWYDFNNKAVHYIMQTFRNKNLLVVLTVPDISFIDGKVRKLLHFIIEAKGVKRREKKNVCKIFRVSSSSRTGKIYWKYLRDRNGNKIAQTKLKIASTRLIKKYEKLATLRKKVCQNEISEELKRKHAIEKAKRQKQSLDEDEVVDKILEAPKMYIKTWGGRTLIDRMAIETVFNCGSRISSRIKKRVENTLDIG